MLVATGVLLGLAAFGGAGGGPPWATNGGALDNYFLVKAPASLVLPGLEDTPERRNIEMLNLRHRVVSVTPLFVEPPRGWRDPALAAALELGSFWIFELDGSDPDIDKIVKQYGIVKRVERAWRDAAIDHCNTPDDTLWGSQWNLQKTKLDCEAVWDAVTAETVLVAVIDSGIDLGHKDIKNNLWVNPGEVAGNGKDDDANGFVDDVNGWDFWNNAAAPDDDNGHGTHVAGIVGAEGDNSRDVAGVCWKGKIQAVKVLNRSAGGTWASIAQGLTYAADNGASVVNMSCGGFGGDLAIETAVDYARGLDVVQVAAAGNNASTEMFYPAAYEGVIAVMATDPNDNRPGWSNHGDWCDLLAPGDGVYSLWDSGLTNVLSGTSQAAPHVTGVAALLRTLNPQLDALDVEVAITTSCDDLGTAGFDSTYQWGRLNAREAASRATMLTREKENIRPGDSVELYVLDVSRPGDLFLLQPSLSGRQPGYTLDIFLPAETRTVPLNWDWLTDFAFSAGSLGIFNGFAGSLDNAGTATARLDLPRGNGMLGRTIVFGGFTVDPNDLSVARRVMNTVAVEIR